MALWIIKPDPISGWIEIQTVLCFYMKYLPSKCVFVGFTSLRKKTNKLRKTFAKLWQTEARSSFRYTGFPQLTAFVESGKYLRYQNDKISLIRGAFFFCPPLRVFLFHIYVRINNFGGNKKAGQRLQWSFIWKFPFYKIFEGYHVSCIHQQN